MRTTTASLGRALLLLALLAPGLAAARDARFFGFRRRSVPEFDPAAAGIVAAIVSGGAVMLAKRKRG